MWFKLIIDKLKNWFYFVIDWFRLIMIFSDVNKFNIKYFVYEFEYIEKVFFYIWKILIII